MNDVESKLILQGDSKGAEKALDTVNAKGQKVAKTMDSIGDETVKAEKKIQDASKKSSDWLQKRIDQQKKLEDAAKKASAAEGNEFGSSSLDNKTTKALKETGGAIGDFESAINAMQGGLLSSLTSIEQFSNIIMSIPPQFVAIGAVAGAAIGGAVLAFRGLSEEMKNSTKWIRDVTERTEEYYRLMADGSTDDINTALEALKIEREAKKLQVQDLKMFAEDVSTTSGSIRTEVNRLTRTIGMDDTFIKAQEDYETASSELDSLNQQIIDLERASQDLGVILRQTNDEVEDITDQENELNRLREQHEKTVSDLTAQEEALIATMEQRRAYEDEDRSRQEQRLQEDKDLTAKFDAQRAELEALFAGADAEAALLAKQEALQDKLADIEEKGNAKIADIRQELVDKTVSINQSIAEETAKYQSDFMDAQKEFQEQSIERQAEYQRKRADLERNFDLTRLQAWAAQDAKSLFFATIAKNQSLSDLNRDEVDAATGASSDFAKQEAERQKAHQERIKELQTELQEFQMMQAEKIDAERASIQELMTAEREAYEQRMALEAETAAEREFREKAFARLDAELGREREQLLKDRSDEDLRIRREREDAALQDTLTAIDVKRDAELAAIDNVIQRLVYVGNIKDIKTGYQGYLQNEINQSQPLPIKGFAQGGIFNKPTYLNAMIAEAEPEAIVPMSRLGEFGGTNYSPTVNVTVNGNLDNVTMEQLQKAVGDEVMAAVEAISEVERLRGRPK